MKKFILTEDDKKNILGMYGLIKEDDNSGRCDSWKNGTFTQGDGIKTPKITITKTPDLIEGLYEGPDNGGCIQRSKFNDNDTPHQLAGITIFYEAAPYLKELYSQGTYVKPDKKNIKMERVENKKFKISIPLISTTEDQAITSINERGGMGHEGNLEEIENIRTNPNHILVDSIRLKSGDMTETIIWFRNKEKFPIKKVSQNKTDSNINNIKNTNQTPEKEKINTQIPSQPKKEEPIQPKTSTTPYVKSLNWEPYDDKKEEPSKTSTEPQDSKNMKPF